MATVSASYDTHVRQPSNLCVNQGQSAYQFIKPSPSIYRRFNLTFLVVHFETIRCHRYRVWNVGHKM